MSNLNDLLKLAGLAARPELAAESSTQPRELKSGIAESKVQEDDVEEGNEFSGALAKAKAAGHTEFEVDGKKYKVQEAAKPDFLDLDDDDNTTEPMKKAADDAELQEESGSYYYERLAQEVFDENPNLDTSGKADEFLNAAFPLLVRDMGSKKKANSLLNYDPDFAADLVSAYGELRRNTTQSTEQDPPFDGGRPAADTHKDKFGNTIKHMAHHLAKQGQQSATKQRVGEQSSSNADGPGNARYEAQLFKLAYHYWEEDSADLDAESKLNALGWRPEYGDDYIAVLLRQIRGNDYRSYTIDEFEEFGQLRNGNQQGMSEGGFNADGSYNTSDDESTDFDEYDFDDTQLGEAECQVCHETPCVCEQPVVSESPTMDTTQLIHLMKLSGISEEAIQQKLDEWANTPNGVGEVEPTVHGDAYDFAQSVNLSLKRYLDAQDMKVQVTEHKVEKLKSLYEEFKKKK
jgi:hypothetical protein